MDQPPTCGLEDPRGWPVPEGATALMREQEGSRALPLGLHPEDSHCWESSMARFLAPKPPPEPLPLLPGPCPRKGLPGSSGTSFLLLNPKTQVCSSPSSSSAGCQQPLPAGPGRHTLSPLSPTSPIYSNPSPHWSVCWVSQSPLGQACVEWVESLPPSPPQPSQVPGLGLV